MQKAPVLRRNDERLIIHFDYDCFYASVVEAENPALKAVPLAIQQKQIVVTCNYEARRRGLYKLQLITEAKKVCPDAVIVLGEDITRFRDASKDLFNFLKDRIWSGRAEKLGFDEVWLDCTDMIEYNVKLINHNDVTNSFFCLDKDDPTTGFAFDASCGFGQVFPKHANFASHLNDTDLTLRLIVGSHLARHLRHELESQKGYTATVGIATNKILSKLVGNVHKPKNQTTILPPYETIGCSIGTISQFLDAHDIDKVPGIGFKLAQKIRTAILGRSAEVWHGLVTGKTKEKITVGNVRAYPGMGPDMLEEILGGSGSPKGIGGKIWELLHGIDDTEVGKAKRVPSQISQEDSYMKYLSTFEQVRKQLQLLSERLIVRMHVDLMEDDEEFEEDTGVSRRWLAHPRTLRLSTRPRLPPGPDGIRPRTFHRISRSAPVPNFVFSLREHPAALADKLVDSVLVDMFRKLHPEKNGWNLSLINIAVTNMAETAAETKDSSGRDIGRMFRRQDDILKDFRVYAEEEPLTGDSPIQASLLEAEWDSEHESIDGSELETCAICSAPVPAFAMLAHQQFHLNS